MSKADPLDAHMPAKSQAQQDGFALNVLERHVYIVRQPPRRMPVQPRSRNALLDTGDYLVAQVLRALRRLLALRDSARRIASASPTIAGTFSVPERRSRSCPPPMSIGSNGVPRRRYSAPTPFGPCSLWPLRLSISTPSLRMFTSIRAHRLHSVGVEVDAAS